MERKRFVDTLAVRYKSSSDAVHERHVAKRKQRNKDLEIVFDPESHKDFVTGFRKRKQQRRKEAVKSLEKLQRENKLEERAERREARREQYDLGYDYKIVGDGSKLSEIEFVGGKKDEERIFDGQEMRSTVKVSVIPTAFDEDGEQTKSRLNPRRDSNARQDEIDKQKKTRTGHKLSKTALSVLSNTKLKIEGKRKFPMSSGKKNTKTGGSSRGKDRLKRGRR